MITLPQEMLSTVLHWTGGPESSQVYEHCTKMPACVPPMYSRDLGVGHVISHVSWLLTGWLRVRKDKDDSGALGKGPRPIQIIRNSHKRPLGPAAVGRRQLGQATGGSKAQLLLPVPCPRCCSTGMLGTGIGSRCGLPGWTSGGLLFPSSSACSSHCLGSFPCVLGLERKWGGLQQGAPGERCPS